MSSDSDEDIYDEEDDEEVMKVAKGFSFSMGNHDPISDEEDEEDSEGDNFVIASTNNRSSKTMQEIKEEKKEEIEEKKVEEPVQNKRLSLTNLIQDEMDKTTEQILSTIQPEVQPVTITKSNELKLEVRDNTTNSGVSPRSPRSPKGQTPAVSSLRLKLRSENLEKMKDKYVSINLDSLSGIAVADIKRNSLSSTAIVDVEVAKAKGLHPVKAGPPSPMCLLAVRKDTSKDHEKKIDIKKPHDQTSVMPKNTNPTWNEKKEIKLDQVKGDSQRWLVVEVRDKQPKGDFLGFVEINLNNIADLVQREEWFELKRRKPKDKVSGSILLRTRIVPERKVEPAIVIRNESFPTIPSFVYNSFWNQHCVRQVSITYCQLTSIPDTFYMLASLELLHLHHNSITTVPKTLGRIFTLKDLDLSHNKISTLPAELSNLKNLQVFNIEENKWTDTEVPPPIVDLDLICDIKGKPATWDQLIEEELRKRQSNAATAPAETDEKLMDEKEKEIQRLLQSMK